MTEIGRLQEAILILKEQRDILGEHLLNEVLQPLQARLDNLHAQQFSSRICRQITILAVQVENLASLTTAFQSAWRENTAGLAHTRGALLEQFPPDAFTAAWGLESASGDHAEQAVRAGLELRKAFDGLLESLPVQPIHQVQADTPASPQPVFRAAVYTAEIFICEPPTPQVSQVVPEHVRIARGLLASAPANTLVISNSTYRLVQGIFNIQMAAPCPLPGLADPLITYAVIGAKPRPFPIPARSVEGILTKTVGQKEQLAQLMMNWLDVVNHRRARCVTITGDAGIGKSRLMDDMRNQLEFRGEAYRYFEGRSTPQSANIPYALIRDILSNRFQIFPSDTPETVREKLVAGICEFTDEDGIEKAHIIGELIGFDFSNSAYIQGIRDDASQLHQRAQQYLIDFFTTVSNQRVTTLFLDNLHWADHGSLELLEKLAIGLRGQPIMLIAMTRPMLFKWYPNWGQSLPNHQFLHLPPLTLEESRSLVADILQKMEHVPQVLSESIAKGSGGNPYYIEETVKLMVDDHVIQPAEPNWILDAERLVKCHIPTTIREAIQARLQKQPPAEFQILCAASVIGRTFWDDMVSYLTGIDRDTTTRILKYLQKQEFLFLRSGSAFKATQEFIFKHHVLHQVTYDSVSGELRKQYHARAAEWLQSYSQTHHTEYTAWVAYHLDKAGRPQEAGSWYLRAGLDAARHYANHDAQYLFSRAMQLLPHTNPADQFAALAWIIHLKDTAKETDGLSEDLHELQSLAQVLQTPQHQAQFHYLQARYEIAQGRPPEALDHCARTIQALAEISPHRLEAEAHILASSAYADTDRMEMSRQELQRALTIARSLDIPQLTLNCLSNLGNICWREFKFEEAIIYHQQALELANEIFDLRGSAYAHLCIGVANGSNKNFTEAQNHFQQSLNLSRRIGEHLGEARALNNWGDLYSARGDYEDAIQSITQALQIFREVNNAPGINASLANLGFLSLQNGQYSVSLDYYQQWFNYCQARPDPVGMAMACTGLAQILTALGQFGRARNYLNQAMTFFMAADDSYGKGRVQSLTGRTAYLSGDITGALPFLLEAAQIPVSQKNIESLLVANLTLGHIYTDQGKFNQASQAYNQAALFADQSRDSHLLLEPAAAKARLALRQDDLQSALNQVREILKRITAAPIDFSDAVFWAYLVCAEVLSAANAPELRDVVYRAQRLLYTIAEKIEDPDIRKTFLDNVPTNRKLTNLRVM